MSGSINSAAPQRSAGSRMSSKYAACALHSNCLPAHSLSSGLSSTAQRPFRRTKGLRLSSTADTSAAILNSKGCGASKSSPPFRTSLRSAAGSSSAIAVGCTPSGCRAFRGWAASPSGTHTKATSVPTGLRTPCSAELTKSARAPAATARRGGTACHSADRPTRRTPVS